MKVIKKILLGLSILTLVSNLNLKSMGEKPGPNKNKSANSSNNRKRKRKGNDDGRPVTKMAKPSEEDQKEIDRRKQLLDNILSADLERIGHDTRIHEHEKSELINLSEITREEFDATIEHVQNILRAEGIIQEGIGQLQSISQELNNKLEALQALVSKNDVDGSKEVYQEMSVLVSKAMELNGSCSEEVLASCDFMTDKMAEYIKEMEQMLDNFRGCLVKSSEIFDRLQSPIDMVQQLPPAFEDVEMTDVEPDPFANIFEESEEQENNSSYNINDYQKAINGDKNLRGVNLRGADLSNKNLEGVDLTGADLSGAILKNTNLKNAIFENATFVKTKFIKTVLDGARFIKAKLERSIFFRIDNFAGALFADTTLKNTRFKMVKFSNKTIFDKTSFFGERTRFEEVRFEKVIIKNNVSFCGALFLDVSFKLSGLYNSSFEGSRFCVVEFLKCNLKNMNMKNLRVIDVSPYSLIEYWLSFSDTNLVNIDFSGSKLRKFLFEKDVRSNDFGSQLNFEGCEIVAARFIGKEYKLPNAHFWEFKKKSKFYKCKFKDVVLEHVYIKMAHFDECVDLDKVARCCMFECKKTDLNGDMKKKFILLGAKINGEFSSDYETYWGQQEPSAFVEGAKSLGYGALKAVGFVITFAASALIISKVRRS